MSSDLHLQSVLPTQQRFGSGLTWGPGAPLAVTGIQKLADQWMMLFLKPKGSHPWRQLEGTEFVYLAGGNVSDPDTIESSVIEYIADANDQFRAMQARVQGLQANEKLANAELVQFTQVAELSFDIWVRVTNVARQGLNVLIPYVVL